MTHIELFKANVRIERNLCYHTECGTDRHRLDVYAPPDVSGAPVVVYLHGGGWRSGTKDRFEHLGRAFAVRGYVAVVVNYRLTPHVKSPAHAQDCAAATAWVQSHIVRFGGDSGTVFLIGHSAGAHLAALLGVDDHYLDSHGFDREGLRAVVAISGVYNLEDHVDTTAFTKSEHVQEAFGDSPEDLRAASPIWFVRDGLPPFLMMVAEDDPDGLRRQSREFADALRAAGADVVFLSVKGRDHFSIVRRFGSGTDPAIQVIDEFLRHVLTSRAPA